MSVQLQQPRRRPAAPSSTASQSPRAAIDVERYAAGLHAGADGVWFSQSESIVSHPDECQDWYQLVEDQSYWFRHRARAIVALMRRFSPAGVLFDVGGGSGHVTQAINQAGFSAVLVEPSADGVHHAQQRGLDPIVCATLEDAALREGSVPAFGLFDVLEHIEDDLGFLRTLKRALTADGRLYLTVPAYNLLWSSYDEFVGHYRRYTIRRLTRRLQQAGFEVETATYLFAMLPPPIFLMRSLPSRLGIARENRREKFQKEHAATGGLASRAAESLLQIELRLLSRGWRIPTGSSCLAVARAE